jgi:hypothetical protein
VSEKERTAMSDYPLSFEDETLKEQYRLLAEQGLDPDDTQEIDISAYELDVDLDDEEIDVDFDL